MQVRFSSKNSESDVLVLALPKLKAGEVFFEEDSGDALCEAINRNIECDAKYKGEAGQTLCFAAPEEVSYKKIILLGLGGKAATEDTLTTCGKALYKALKETGYKTANILMNQKEKSPISDPEALAILADAAKAASYAFTEYKTDAAARTDGLSLNFIAEESLEAAEAAYDSRAAVTAGEFLAANMGNEPGNILYPESAANLIRRALEDKHGVTVKILHEDAMEDEFMGAALAVGKGSQRPPRMVVIEYDGTNGKTKDWPLALVGKGVTFDSGGISLKPGAGMEEMKMDMCGAAAVVGTMYALAARKANTKLVAICGFAENMPDGNAYRPGDILTSRSGKTIEVANTDAEGRLVLCDAMDYIQDKYAPKTMLDLATLTGAVLVSLGNTYTGVFTPQDSLWKKLDKAGKASGQPGWRLPLHADFAQAVKGKVADLHNLGNLGRMAGSSTAAEFLHAFVKASTNWAHLDIAGTAMPKSGIANGYGVRWLNRFIADNYENGANDNKTPEKKPRSARIPG